MKIDFKTVLVILFLGFVWGSAFILMKIGITAFTPVQLASLRLVFAGSVAIFFFVGIYKKLKTADWLLLALSGTIGNLIPAYLFAMAAKEIPSSLSGALNALTPLSTLVFGVIVFKVDIKIKHIIGISMGLLGALILIFTNPKASGLSFHVDYVMPCMKVVLAAVLYGINVNIIKSKLSHLTAYANSMVPLTLVAVPALFIGMSQHTYSVAIEPSALKPLLAVFVLGVFGSAISLIVFNRLVKKSSALFASSVTYLIPLVAYGWGLYFGESIGWVQFLGMVMIMAGITLSR
ncbi:MAG: DMT family transporter [bacterium]|nr:DMT family transporter [bacterium]